MLKKQESPVKLSFADKMYGTQKAESVSLSAFTMNRYVRYSVTTSGDSSEAVSSSNRSSQLLHLSR